MKKNKRKNVVVTTVTTPERADLIAALRKLNVRKASNVKKLVSSIKEMTVENIVKVVTDVLESNFDYGKLLAIMVSDIENNISIKDLIAEIDIFASLILKLDGIIYSVKADYKKYFNKELIIPCDKISEARDIDEVLEVIAISNGFDENSIGDAEKFKSICINFLNQLGIEDINNIDPDKIISTLLSKDDILKLEKIRKSETENKPETKTENKPETKVDDQKTTQRSMKVETLYDALNKVEKQFNSIGNKLNKNKPETETENKPEIKTEKLSALLKAKGSYGEELANLIINTKNDIEIDEKDCKDFSEKFEFITEENITLIGSSRKDFQLQIATSLLSDYIAKKIA